VAYARAGSTGEAGPPLDPVLEVRLAIVMYGGVSLSIYMNGVAQELFRLVRATAGVLPGSATALPKDELTGSEVAYRAMAQLREEDGDDPLAVDPARPIGRRFVIDVLSGTSAGGINAVFLAKALANDQGMAGLTDLWIDEGDIGRLLNDRGSKVPGLVPERPPESLLNSGRMYVRLLEAFDRMDRENPWRPDSPSPLADEIDLFVTTTDLNGYPLPLRLANAVVKERRYRNVYRFHYSAADLRPGEPAENAEANPFLRANNPFLAFACRCTSAFPLAFKPMVLGDIDAMLARFPQFEGRGSRAPAWQAFFPDYTADPADPMSLPFRERPFADGGALDNKPFGHAVDVLRSRRAQVPVDRKLLFVEPDPTPPPTTPDPDQRPNALQNFLEQSVLLPRQETVRDDLDRLDDLNRLARRVDGALREVVRHLEPPDEPSTTIRRAPASTLNQSLDELVEARGTGFAGYHWLRVESVIEDLAVLFGGLVGAPSGREYLVAIRGMLKAWRDLRYAATPEPGKRTLGRFLWRFDVDYRYRRLSFLERRTDALYGPDAEGRELLDRFGATASIGAEDLRTALRMVKQGITRATYSTTEGESELRRRGTRANPNPLREIVESAGITLGDLARILDHPSDEVRRERAAELVGRHLDMVDRAMCTVFRTRARAARSSFGSVGDALAEAGAMGEAGATVAAIVAWAYNRFDSFDAVAFPLQYGSNAGEGDVVEVIRISPGDATALVSASAEDGAGKVTGARVSHFGAFLDRLWRENDIMWGRLDAAEILIQTLVPADLDRRDVRVGRLRDEAFCAILREELRRDELLELFRAGQEVQQDALPPRMAQVINAASSNREVIDEFKRSYRRPATLPPKDALRNVGRGAHVMGQVFRSIAYERGGPKLALPFAVVSRGGQLLTGMVEAAVPRSWAHLLLHHWFALLYLFEFLALAGGILLHALGVIGSGLIRFAIVALLATTAANVALWLVARRLKTGKLWKSALWIFAGLAVFAAVAGILTLAVFGALHASENDDWIPWAAGGLVIAVAAGLWLTKKKFPQENLRRALWLAGALLLAGAAGCIVALAIYEYIHLGQTHDWIPFVADKVPGPTPTAGAG
jgi:patatin-related protein